MGLSIRDMARALGVSKSQVARDKQAGMPMDDADAARQWRLKNLDPSRTAEGRIDRPAPAKDDVRVAVGGLASAAGAGESTAGSPADDGDDPPPPGGDTEEYRRHRTERERIRMERERLELERDRGLVIDLADAQRLAFTAFRTLRDRAGFIVDRVPGLSDAQRQALDAELSAVFSVDPAKLLVEADADDEDDDAPL